MKKLSKFTIGLIAYIAVLVILIVILLVYTNNSMKKYEASQPDKVMEQLITDIKAGKIPEMSMSEAGKFENIQADVLEKFTNIENATITYDIKTSGYDASSYNLKIDDEKVANLMLEKSVDTDELTGIYNRTSTERRINDILLKDDGRNNHTMILIDVDDFKNVNNVLGYVVGDVILRKIGEILLQMFRQDFDILGRVDGDMFVIFVRNTSDVFYIENLCKEICKRLSSECTPDNLEPEISVSIGIAFTDNKNDSFEKIYIKAEKALQRQINNGKNGYSF
jgi:diguanylate cyclase (GGDEF)-like protein